MLTGQYLYECLEKYPRFQLIHMVARRVNELESGARPLVESKFSSYTEIALQEIAAGRIYSASRRPEVLAMQEEEKAREAAEE